MSNFEQALELMDKRWLDSLVEAEDYVPSKRHQREMKKLFEKMRGDKYHKLTRRTIALLVAAAILLSAATIAIANEASRNFIIEKFKEYSVYRVENSTDLDVNALSIDYIPDGFVAVDHSDLSKLKYIEYLNADKKFCVWKSSEKNDFYFDTEEYDYKTIKLNNIDYTVYSSTDNKYGIIWNNNQFVYLITGENISDTELIKIAISTN